ncbi:MarR family transcriptional regulator [Virgibacillus sp. C22-A2]|uniref:HTH-type transcriptional regulator n=1 Tax=Virgibacillus tibetensis TaxID=3042313 RepID=A0ABU6KEE3_9BACI|nr:MarR family transcriptional regulator [Virgibacillus sp. C22-A2]
MQVNKKEEVTNKIMVEFSKTIEMFDLTPLEARLFAFLYLSEKPLTLDDMSDAMGKSKTSMSTGVRSLLELNLVTRVWKKGERKDLFQANTQLFKTFMNTYINKWIDATKHQNHSLVEINKLLVEQKRSDFTDDLASVDNRLNDIIDFHTQVEALFREMKQD